MRKIWIAALLIMLVFTTGCQAPKIRLFPSQADPFLEFTLQGKKKPKILVITIEGTISTAPKVGLIRTRPSVVQETVSQLRRAEEDEDIKAVILKINSPGGSVTASDILYNEIATFKKDSGAKVVAALMGACGTM